MDKVKSMTVQQLYDHVTKFLTPEEALKRMLAFTLSDYQQLRAMQGQAGQPEGIIAAAALELGWNIAVEGDREQLRGLSVGTDEYLDSILKDKA